MQLNHVHSRKRVAYTTGALLNKAPWRCFSGWKSFIIPGCVIVHTFTQTPPACLPACSRCAELHVVDGVPQTIFVKANYSMEVRLE
jgi:hypothetical protein